MRTGPILQLALLVMLLAGPSEEFFFEYPKKALQEFLQSLKKQPTKPKTDIQHYHVHYYPMPVPMLAWRAPDKRDLEKLYIDAIRSSFGWADYRYKYAPDPSLIMSGGFQQLLNDPFPWDQDVLESEDAEASIDRNMKGILVQVPVSQQIIMQWLRKSRKQATFT